MIFDKETAKQTAEVLLQINAIKLQPNDPFTWASGWKSPITVTTESFYHFLQLELILEKQWQSISRHTTVK